MKRILQLLTLLATFLSFSCTPIQVAPPALSIALPARPVLERCPEFPGLTGKVFSKPNEKQLYVELTLEAAQALQEWRKEIELCTKLNAFITNGHFEKLENRIKALTGVGPN